MYYISLRLAWISVVLLIFTALRYTTKRNKKNSINYFFRKYHIPCGILMIITSFLHSIFAGNEITTTFENLQIASVFFTLNFGTISFIVILFLWLTYLLKKKFKKTWIVFHRRLTILLILLTVFHICNNL